MIASFIYIKYKPLYKVTLNGEVIGYVENKEKIQEKIEDFKNNLGENITSIKINEMPEFELELVSDFDESKTQEDVILAKIEESAEITCKTYAIKLDGVEKAIVTSKEEADEVVNEIKADVKDGVELNLEIEEQEKDKKELEDNALTVEVAKLNINEDVKVKVEEYEKKQAEAAKVSSRASTTARSSSTAVNSTVSSGTSGIFIKPVTGATITSRFGQRSSGNHTGLDMAIATGTPVYAAAAGTVTFAGYKGSYGYLVIIDHGNGYQTYYAHCSKLYVSAGQTVAQGQNISAVGSTGNSTGPHLHFEVRYNGSILNPQNFI